MKKSLWVLTVLGLCAVAAFGAVVNAQATKPQEKPSTPPTQMAPAGDHSAVEKALMANETKITEMFAKKDIAGLKTLIAENGYGIDPMGGNPVSQMYAELPKMDFKVTDQKLSDFHFQWIDDNTVVMSYTWTGKGTMMGQPLPSPTYSSTVWTKKNNKWWAVFHQETPAMPAPPKK